LWQAAYADDLIDAAVEEGLINWEWQPHTWGVVLELAFADESGWDRFRQHPVVSEALSDVPDPVTGLIVHRGWGGRSGTDEPRKPKPLAGSGAAALPIPDLYEDVFGDSIEDWLRQPARIPAMN
jgi:hypothetical protein